MCYDYYGDNMCDISSIKGYSDIDSISKNTKYINILIDSDNRDIINYFLVNGKDYCYSDIINDKNGYMYTSYDIFKYGEDVITRIINGMPKDLNDIEMVRYLYISLGKLVGFDINLSSDKNEVISFNTISYLNNIWSSLYYKKITNLSLVKLFVYLCSRINVKCDIVSSSISGSFANRVYVGNSFLVVDLFRDLANIKGGFITEYFDKYNSNIDMDKRVLYIRDNYSDYYFDREFSNIKGDNLLKYILDVSFDILDVSSINSYELFCIYKKIFGKYFSGYDIGISNFYLNNEYKDHFIVFSYDNMYYSFNYTKGCFVNVDYNYLVNSIKCNKIGLYLNEGFGLKERMI